MPSQVKRKFSLSQVFILYSKSCIKPRPWLLPRPLLREKYSLPKFLFNFKSCSCFEYRFQMLLLRWTKCPILLFYKKLFPVERSREKGFEISNIYLIMNFLVLFKYLLYLFFCRSFFYDLPRFIKPPILLFLS